MDRLRLRWNRKLEGDAIAGEYSASKQFGHKHSSADVSLDRGPELYPPEIAQPDTQLFLRTKQHKSGRPSVRPDHFVSLAGNLWHAARHKNKTAQVTHDQLLEIASNLDDRQFVPPSQYLEGNCAMKVKLFNSMNSRSKTGPILTWSRLVAIADKDHVRAMRRLLSRCAAEATES